MQMSCVTDEVGRVDNAVYIVIFIDRKVGYA